MTTLIHSECMSCERGKKMELGRDRSKRNDVWCVVGAIMLPDRQMTAGLEND